MATTTPDAADLEAEPPHVDDQIEALRPVAPSPRPKRAKGSLPGPLANPTVARAVAFAGSGLLLLLITQLVFAGLPNTGGRGTPGAILFQGLVSGLLTAMTAAGMVLIYRTIRIINFAAASLGAGRLLLRRR